MKNLLVVASSVLLSLAGITNSPLSSPVRWSVNGHYYEARLRNVNWQTAQDECLAGGGYLATITSLEENAFVFGLVSGDSAFWYWDDRGYGYGPWLGGFQPDGSPEPAGNWEWVTGEPFTYTNWDVNQPDNDNGNQSRLRFFKTGGLIGDRWDDAYHDPPVAVLRGYIFETDTVVPSLSTVSLLVLQVVLVLLGTLMILRMISRGKRVRVT